VKFFTRAAAAITAAFISLFIAVPAFAHEEVEKFNPADEFSAAGQPVNTVAILITGAVVLIVVLLLTAWLSNMFKPAASKTEA